MVACRTYTELEPSGTRCRTQRSLCRKRSPSTEPSCHLPHLPRLRLLALLEAGLGSTAPACLSPSLPLLRLLALLPVGLCPARATKKVQPRGSIAMMRAAFFRAVPFLAVRTQPVRCYLSRPAIMQPVTVFPFENSCGRSESFLTVPLRMAGHRLNMFRGRPGLLGAHAPPSARSDGHRRAGEAGAQLASAHGRGAELASAGRPGLPTV